MFGACQWHKHPQRSQHAARADAEQQPCSVAPLPARRSAGARPGVVGAASSATGSTALAGGHGALLASCPIAIWPQAHAHWPVALCLVRVRAAAAVCGAQRLLRCDGCDSGGSGCDGCGRPYTRLSAARRVGRIGENTLWPPQSCSSSVSNAPAVTTTVNAFTRSWPRLERSSCIQRVRGGPASALTRSEGQHPSRLL